MPNPIHLPASLLQSVIDVLMDCGGGRNECIVYATASRQAPDQIDGLIHPIHASTPISTTVDLTELHRVWDKLRDTAHKIVLQIHSHPGPAFHSCTDDNFPIIHSVGFLSLVIPAFGSHGLEGAHLAIYEGGGTWFSPPPTQRGRYLVIDHAS
jgi:proteasome lid subunit RPN8/RPN11